MGKGLQDRHRLQMFLRAGVETGLLECDRDLIGQGLEGLDIVHLQGILREALDIDDSQQVSLIQHGNAHGRTAPLRAGKIIGVRRNIAC